jgi:hypothetical protein
MVLRRALAILHPKFTRRRPLFEPLEDRRLLACDVFVDDQTRTLFVKGDDGDNKIAVHAEPSQTLGVHCDGVTTHVKLTRLDEVQVKAGGGNDRVSTQVLRQLELHVFGEGGDDTLEYRHPDHYYDVDSEDPITPADSLAGGGGHDTFIVIPFPGTDDFIKAVGVGDRTLPDPEFQFFRPTTGDLLKQVFVQETEAITINAGRGDDRVELHDRQGLLAGIDWSIHTGRGDDSVSLDLGFPDQEPPPTGAGLAGDEQGLLPAVMPYTIDLRTGRGDDNVDVQVENPQADVHLNVGLGRGDDRFSANVIVGTGVSLPGIINPCNDIDVFGGRGDDKIVLNVGEQKVNPNDPNDPIPHLSSELEVHFSGDDGNDELSVVLQKVRLAPSEVTLRGGHGNDKVAMAVDAAMQDFASLEILLDGGAGLDTALVTQKVREQAKIVHFEKIVVIP